MKLTVITHYLEDDPECYGDYDHITIEDESGDQITSFGDYYHDKGDDKVDAFIEGVEWALKTTIERENVRIADVE
jgi:hypothetical protein